MTKQEKKEKLIEQIELLAGRLEQLQQRLNVMEWQDQQEGDYHFAAWYLGEKGRPMSPAQVNSYASKIQGWKIKPEYRAGKKVYTRDCLDAAIERGFSPVADPKKYVKS